MGRWISALSACAVVAVLAGCSGVSSSTAPSTATPASAEPLHSTSVTVASTLDSPTLDPAWSYAPMGDSLLGLTNDGLVGFRHVGGSPGATLVPDLATAMPTSTDGGRTWTATIRQGIHYSTGQAVQPSDVRRAIERDFALGSQGLFALRTIVGAAACDSAPATCSLADGIQTNDLNGEITFNLTRPNAEFPFILALPLTYPLPPGTPTTWATTQALPATGPYVVSSFLPGKQLILSRNPQFHVWAPDAQPAGVADHIVFTLGMTAQDALHAVVQGAAVTAVGVPLRADHVAGATIVALPSRSTGMLTLNTRVAPFTSVLARRAFALAIDRGAMNAQLDGAGLTRPGCRMLPPGFPGYRPGCPAPDLGRARSLVRASGMRGTQVTVAVVSEQRRWGVGLVRTLDAIGFHARYEPGEAKTFGDPANHSQVTGMTWTADYPSPANIFGGVLGCDAYRPGTANDTNLSQYCNHHLDAAVAAATAVGGLDPSAAAARWAQIDQTVVASAPVIPVDSSIERGVVASGAQDARWNPVWGLLLGLVKPG